MLIRSQDKTILVNVDNVSNIAIRDINGATVIHIGSSSSCCIIAEYSTKAKAMKVLDMIQEAYAGCKAGQCTITGLTSMAYARDYTSKEEIDQNIKKIKECIGVLTESYIFQMSNDSEVKV